MPQRVAATVNIENARLAFRNFSGKEGKFNPAGRRNFCVILDNKTGEDLARQGWNIKYLKPREEGDEPQAYISVTVNYKGGRPPKIIVMTTRNKTFLEESSVHVLDWADISNVDLILNPSTWTVNGKTGIKAYLKSLYVTLNEDEFEYKYVDVPDAAISNLVRPNDQED
jgi:hypothetical protein